jgi:hypothetical protein
MAATILIALALCFLSMDVRDAAAKPSAACSLELRVSAPAVQNGNDLVMIVRLGTNGTSTISIGPWSRARLTQYFESWHEKAIETLFKRLHMA